MAAKKAAIDLDSIGEKQIGELSAKDFLDALEAGGLAAQHLAVWPEKKKVEYWTEPENVAEVKVGDFVTVIRREKKKVELEIDPGVVPPIRRRFWPEKKKIEYELPDYFPPREWPIPDFGSEKKKAEVEVDPILEGLRSGSGEVLDRIADAVAERLKRR